MKIEKKKDRRFNHDENRIVNKPTEPTCSPSFSTIRQSKYLTPDFSQLSKTSNSKCLNTRDFGERSAVIVRDVEGRLR